VGTSLGIQLGMELLGHTVSLYVYLLRNCQTVQSLFPPNLNCLIMTRSLKLRQFKGSASLAAPGNLSFHREGVVYRSKARSVRKEQVEE